MSSIGNPNLKTAVTITAETTDSWKELSEFDIGDFFIMPMDALNREQEINELFCLCSFYALLSPEDEMFDKELEEDIEPTHCNALCLNDGQVYGIPLDHIGYPVKIGTKSK